MERNPFLLPLAIIGGSVISALVCTAALFIYGLTSGLTHIGAAISYGWWMTLAALTNMLLASTVGLAWHAYATFGELRKSQHYWMPALALGVTLPFFFAPPHQDTAIFYAIGASLGGLTGYVFWLIRRPDRDANSSVIPADWRESRDPDAS